jgi:high-affinity iron transporter
MLASLLIVFREAIEAGLIVGIVLAVTRGVPGRMVLIGMGVAGGVAGACLVAAFAREIGALFSGSGQEIFDASVLLIAVVMLTWHNVWMAGHGRAMAREMRAMGGEIAAGRRPMSALAIVVGIAVLREGSEVVLFLYGVAAQGGETTGAMLAGGILGLLAGAGVSALIYFGLLAIPARRLFAVTSGLITLLAAGMASQAVLFIQQGGYFEHLTNTLWNTSWLLPESGEGWRGILGRMLHTLVGYSDAPDGAQLLVYMATIATIVLLTKWERSRREFDRAVVRPAKA